MDIFQQDENSSLLLGRMTCVPGPCSLRFGSYDKDQADDQTHRREDKSGWTATNDEA